MEFRRWCRRAGDAAFRAWLATYLRRAASPGAPLALLRMNTADRHPQRAADRSGADPRHASPRRPRREDRRGPFSSPPTSPARGWSSSPARTTCRGSATRTRSSTRCRSSSPACGRRPSPTACSRRSSSPTSCNSTDSGRAALGDRRWRDLLARHHALVRDPARALSRSGSRHRRRRLLRHLRRPGRAVRCACAIRDGVRDLGIEVRAGVHTGEVELSGEKASGIAVHIAARILAAAANRRGPRLEHREGPGVGAQRSRSPRAAATC